MSSLARWPLKYTEYRVRSTVRLYHDAFATCASYPYSPPDCSFSKICERSSSHSCQRILQDNCPIATHTEHWSLEVSASAGIKAQGNPPVASTLLSHELASNPANNLLWYQDIISKPTPTSYLSYNLSRYPTYISPYPWKWHQTTKPIAR